MPAVDLLLILFVVDFELEPNLAVAFKASVSLTQSNHLRVARLLGILIRWISEIDRVRLFPSILL